MRGRKLRWLVLVFASVAAAGMWLYAHWIGFPRRIAGHWVHPQVTWYWTGVPIGYPFPAIVTYVYTDERGRKIKHGPYVERGVRGFFTVTLARTGFYLEDQPDGLFTEYPNVLGHKITRNALRSRQKNH